MKSLILILSVLVLILGSLSAGYCSDNAVTEEYVATSESLEIDRDDITYTDTPINKLGRGVINMATFWLEIPAEVAKVSHEQDPATGVTVGVMGGVVTGVVRGLSGIYDTVTFPVCPYDKPVVKPEYAWTAADKQIKAWLW